MELSSMKTLQHRGHDSDLPRCLLLASKSCFTSASTSPGKYHNISTTQIPSGNHHSMTGSPSPDTLNVFKYQSGIQDENALTLESISSWCKRNHTRWVPRSNDDCSLNNTMDIHVSIILQLSHHVATEKEDFARRSKKSQYSAWEDVLGLVS